MVEEVKLEFLWFGGERRGKEWCGKKVAEVIENGR
jgi:hypothetical protein